MNANNTANDKIHKTNTKSIYRNLKIADVFIRFTFKIEVITKKKKKKKIDHNKLKELLHLDF